MQYTWTPATGLDIQSMLDITIDNLQQDIGDISVVSRNSYARNLSLAVVNSFFAPNEELLYVCKDDNNQLLGYTWADVAIVMPWSDDHYVSVKMVQLNVQSSPRLRIQLIKDMMQIWENFAKQANVSIICSSTMRENQSPFLKLHLKNGYIVRGSLAYKKLNTTQATPAN
jgi:hypothetical protein